MKQSRVLVPSLLSALVGGVVVAILFSALDLGGDTTSTTVVRQAPLVRGADSSAAGEGEGLTANQIYKRDAPGVVNIRAEIVRQVDSPFELFPSRQQGESTGSGFVVDKSGTILTNAHVIEGASKVTVQFEDRKLVDARVMGKDSSTDLAVLRVDPDGLDLQPLQLGRSKSVQVGDPTIAIGNPFGLDRTLTTGVVSALQRRITAPSGFEIKDVIQTDAAINPGNSGGPLLDAAGRVIGINSQIATGGGGGQGNIGIGFAIPIDTAKQVIPQLKSQGRVDRAYLGVTGATIDSTLKPFNLASDKGVLVQDVTAGGPAAKAGIRGGRTRITVSGNSQPVALGGDIIVSIEGRPVMTMDDVAEAVAAKKPGDSMSLQIIRDGKQQTVTVTLGTRPNTVDTDG
jgi:S1-C subfamily serine protease